MHVVDVALFAQYRGQGIGERLLRELCDEARAKQVALRLSVRAGHAAERLYRRMGFLACGGDGQNVAMEWRANKEAL